MTKLNLKPTPGYVLVEPLEAEVKTASGIYLPDTASEKPQKGRVIAVGGSIYDDGREIGSPVKLDEIVFYKEWGGNKVKIEGEEYMFVKFEDILATEG